MNPTADDVKRAIDAARALERQGRFAKVKTGDERAASYFARWVAAQANPSGSEHDWGWLSKPAGGFNVDGYADGAIVFGNNPADLNNVLKIVTQVGSHDPNAIQIGSAVQPRRASDVWVKPVPLPEFIPAYLGGSPVPPPEPTIPPFPPRDVVINFVVGPLSKFYQQKGRPVMFEYRGQFCYVDFEGIVVWMAEYLRRCQLGESGTDASRHVLEDVAAAWR